MADIDSFVNMTIPELPFDTLEALNQTRINLAFCGDDKKVIMVTSSFPNEGKSFVAVHLWQMLAEMGANVLLVDCDLRNSEIRSKYKLSGSENMCGITEYLAGQCPLNQAVYETPVERGFIMPVVTPIINPSILLESRRFELMLQSVKKTFDYVIVDTPPVQVVGDALAVAPYCDGSVVVVRANETPRRSVLNTIHSLKRTSTPMLGTILNGYVKKKLHYRYYNKDYYYYGYGDKG